MPAVGQTNEGQLLVFTETQGIGTSGRSPTATPSAEATPSTGPAPAQVESSLVAVNLGTMEEAWRLALKAPSRTGVTIDGGRVFVADGDGNVYAADLATGTMLWSYPLPAAPAGPVTVADGKVFAIPYGGSSQSRVDAAMIALDEQTGNKIWEKILVPSSSLASLPSSAGGVVVAAYPDGVAYGLSTDNGNVVWSARTTGVVSPFVAPALSTGTALLGEISGGLQQIDTAVPDRRWLFEFNQQVIQSSPVLVGRFGLIGVGDGSVGAVDLTTGHLVWRSSTSSGYIGVISVGKGSLVAVRGGDQPALLCFRADPAGALIDVPSPTVPRPASILFGFTLALLIMSTLILAPFRLLLGRRWHVEAPTSDGAIDTAEYTEVEA